MTDNPETLQRYRLPLQRDRLKQAAAMAPFLRYVPKNPLFLLGAAVVGMAGVMAWRNRERIATAAGPMIDDARAKGQALVDDAKLKARDLVDEARVQTQKVGDRIAAARRGSSADEITSELH
jgi:hypothetical protein